MSGPKKDTPSTAGGRFVKGKSGNPNGRPRKGAPPLEAKTSAFDIITELTLPMAQDGVVREVTLQEALTLKIYQDALRGSVLARKKILKMIAARDAIRAKEQKSRGIQTRKISIRNMSVDPSNADAAMLILDIARHDPARADLASERAQLLLEPWAVQAALSRRRSTVAPSSRSVSEIERCTRDPSSLKWPRGSRQ